MAELMSDIQRRINGLSELDRQLVTYYTLATHGLESAETFPLLVFKGPMGTGKSKTMRLVKSFAYGANAFSLRAMTVPTVRDELINCHNGTAIIEEADHGWKDDQTFERMLSDRYARTSAETALKVQRGNGNYVTQNSLCFGASVLHRRTPFADPALNGRSIFIRFSANHNRTYEEFREDAEEVQYGCARFQDMTFVLPKIPRPLGIAGRILDTYQPILAVAHLCGDRHFLEAVLERLELETVQLKEAQSIEPVAIVLRALIEKLSRPDGTLDFRNYIRISDLVEVIWESHRMPIKPHQVAESLRDLGFNTKNSHGYTVVVPVPLVLLQACAECGYEDDSVIALRKELLQGREGRAGGSVSPSITKSPIQALHGRNGLPALPCLPESRNQMSQAFGGGPRISLKPSDFESPRPNRKR